jgi:predicted enzyme related to lactoylglutathione lyase
MASTVTTIIVTPNLESLRTFYSTLLGAPETGRFPEDGPTFFVQLRLGDSDLMLVSEASVTAGDPGRRALSIEVPDVDALLARVTELGGEVTGPPNDMPWGQRVAHIADPDGNLVNLTRPV